MGLQLCTDHDTRQTDIKPIPIGIQVKKKKPNQSQVTISNHTQDDASTCYFHLLSLATIPNCTENNTKLQNGQNYCLFEGYNSDVQPSAANGKDTFEIEAIIDVKNVHVHEQKVRWNCKLQIALKWIEERILMEVRTKDILISYQEICYK